MKNLSVVAWTALSCIGAAAVSAPSIAQTTHTITVNADGSYSPQTTTIQDGDEVEWDFPDRRRAVVRLSGDTAVLPACDAYAPYEHDDPYEFTGPMPQMPSGTFALGPKAEGLTEYDLGDPVATCPDDPSDDDTIFVAGGRKLCKPTESSPTNAVLQSSLDNPAVAGVFLRFDWNKLEIAPGDFDWTVLDREVERIVEAGKLYSIGIKAGKAGTPPWLFDELNLPALYLQDGGSETEEGECGFTMKLADPTDPPYGQRYGQMLAAVADHLKRKSAFYRALSLVKASGANLISHENRLPKRCTPGCPVCNTWVWAANGYTPQGLYDFYIRQFAQIAANFPVKNMSYMLIQAGFPRVQNEIEYEGCVTDECELNIPGGTEQTSQIIDLGADLYPLDLVIQHNGLKSAPSSGTCPNEGIHPADLSPGDGIPPLVSEYDELGPGTCPNPHVLRKGAEGSVTGFQTVNLTQVNTLQHLDQTLLNGLDNSDAVFFEVYEELLWLAHHTPGVLDPAATTPRTLLDWANQFNRRRRNAHFTDNGLPDPYPTEHRHSFVRPAPVTDDEYVHFTDPAYCEATGPSAIGTIIIEQ